MFLRLLSEKATTNVADDWQTRIVNAVENIMVPLLVIACSIGMIWAIIVGIKMIKADDKSARDENKAKLINIAISIVAVAVLIGLFYALKNWVETSAATEDGLQNKFDDIYESSTVVGGPLRNTLSLVKQCARMIVFKG